MLSCVPLTETRRLYKTKYRTYIVTGSWRCVLLFISQFYFTAFGSYGSHNLRLLIFNHDRGGSRGGHGGQLPPPQQVEYDVMRI